MDAEDRGIGNEGEGKPAYRVDAQALKGDLPLLGLLAASLAFGLWALPRMPQSVPVHWGISGEPDRWGPPWQVAILCPAFGLAVWALLVWLPLVDPRRRNFALFPGTLRLFRYVLTLFFVGLQVVTVLPPLGRPVDTSLFVGIGLPLLFIVLGNSMGRLRQNYFVGIRVPWTIASEEVWNATHRFAGKLWVACGFLMLAGLALPKAPSAILMAVLLGVMLVVPVVHSYLLYRRLKGPTG